MGRPSGEVVGRFGKVYAKVWRDEVFRALSPDSQRLWFYMLSSPCASPVPGLMVMPVLTAAYDLGLSAERLTQALEEITDEEMAEYDPITQVLWMPRALRYDPPASSKNVLSWLKVLPLIPECALKEKAIDALWASGLTFDVERPKPARIAAGRTVSDKRLKKYAASDGASDALQPTAISHQPNSISHQPNPRARENEKQPAASPQGAPESSPLGEQLESVFLEERGVPYEWDFVSENALRTLLKHGGTEVLRRWRIGLNTPFPGCNAVADLARSKNWNAYGGKEKPSGRPKDMRKGYAEAQDQDWTGDGGYGALNASGGKP